MGQPDFSGPHLTWSKGGHPSVAEDLAHLPELPTKPLCPQLLSLSWHPLDPAPGAVWAYSRPLHLAFLCLDLSTAVHMARSSPLSYLCLNVPCSQKPSLLKTAGRSSSFPVLCSSTASLPICHTVYWTCCCVLQPSPSPLHGRSIKAER